jgi:hypothetical protein
MRTMSSSRRRTASGERRGNQRPTAGFWRPAWREGSREGSGPGSPYSPARSNVRAVRAPRTGPHLDHRPPALWLARSRTTALLGPYEVSPDHPDGVVAACQQQAPPDAPTVKGPFLFRRKSVQAAGSSGSLRHPRSRHQEAFQRFTLVPAHGFASAPSRPPVTRTPWPSATRTSTAKVREGLSPPSHRNC